MARRDVPLWHRWLDLFGSRYQAFFYDVALGSGTDPGSQEDPSLRAGFIRVTRLRVDALGVQPDRWTLFEVRPTAGAGALGALVTYTALWALDPPDRRPLHPTLVTDVLRPELKTL